MSNMHRLSVVREKTCVVFLHYNNLFSCHKFQLRTPEALHASTVFNNNSKVVFIKIFKKKNCKCSPTAMPSIIHLT